jgi:hypothetical protein
MKVWGENWIRDPGIPYRKRFLSAGILKFLGFIWGVVNTKNRIPDK